MAFLPLRSRSMTAFTPHHTNDDPALEAGRLLTRIGVFLLFVVALIAPVIAGQTIYILLPVGAALLLMGAAIAPDRREKTAPLRGLLTTPPFLAALFLAGWAALSLNWTPFHGGPTERYWKDAGTLALVAIACGFLPARTRVCDLNLLPIGVAAAALGMIAAAAYGFFARRSFTLEEILDGDALARSGVGLVLIMWPAAGALAMRGKWRFAAALMLVSGVAALASGAPNVAPPLIAGFAIFGLSFGRPREARLWLAPLAAATILLSPLLALGVRFFYQGHAPELLKSLDVWGHIFASGGARSLLGHGFGSAIYGLFGGYLDPKAPRSLAFQIWFDLGIVGAAAFAGAAYKAFSIVGLTRPSLAPFLLAGLSAGLVVCLLGPAGEQLWAFTLAGLDAVAFVMVMRGQFRTKRPHLPRWAIVDDED
jgi:hypothetical protein